MQHRSLYKQVSTLHVLCSDVGLCCIAEMIIQRPYSKCSVLGLACEIIFWLYSHPASVFVLALHVVCVVVLPWKDSFLSPKSLVITELTITELSVKFRKCYYRSLSMNMD